MIPHIREGVIEFLRYPDEPFRESDLVMDRLISRLHKPLLQHKWGDCDVYKMFRKLRLYRAKAWHKSDVNTNMFELIFDLRSGNTLDLTINMLYRDNQQSLAREVKSYSDWIQQYIQLQVNPGQKINNSFSEGI